MRNTFLTTPNSTINGPLLVDKAHKRGRKKKIVVASTMDEGDLEHLLIVLADHFSELLDQERPEPLEDVLRAGNDLENVFSEDTDDMGVSAFKDKTYEELSTLLGFPEGRPPLFSKFRSKDSTINSWDDPDESPRWTQGGEGLQPLALQWHQLCGVAAMVDKMFVQKQGLGTNVCLGDDVGLGKSAQIMGYIAFLIIVWFAQQNPALVQPPILGAFTLLCFLSSSWKIGLDRRRFVHL